MTRWRMARTGVLRLALCVGLFAMVAAIPPQGNAPMAEASTSATNDPRPLQRAVRGPVVQVREVPPLPAAFNAPRVPWPGPGQVAVTFDDGPCPNFTPRVVDMMGDRVATFYFIGSSVRRFPDVVRGAAARGHSIQNHSWDHRAHRRLDDVQIARSTLATGRAILEITGIQPTSFRPPYGSTDTRVRHMINSLGYSEALWNGGPHTMDAGADTIRSTVLGQIDRAVQRSEGLVLLFHDCSGRPLQLLEALPHVLAALDASGLTLVALA